MRISDWSSDVCSSDLCGTKARIHSGQRSKRRQFGYLAGSSQRNSPMPSERPFDRLPHMGIDRRPSRDFYHSLVASKRTIPAGTSAELPAVLFVRWEPWMIHPHGASRSEEHTSELQSLMRISYAVFCLKK